MKLTGDRQVALGKLAATTKERQAARDLKMKTSALKFRLRNKNKNFTPVKAIEGEPPRGAVSETRSTANRRRSTKRKEDAVREKREKTGKSGHAYAYGKKSSKEFGKAKIRRSAADELESYAKTNPGSNPSRRKDVTAIAAHALRGNATRNAQAGENYKKEGKVVAKNKKMINRLQKRVTKIKMMGESALSKEVREKPGSEMTLARGRISAGQYAKIWKDKKGARKSGRKAAKHIAISRNETDTKTQAQNDRWEKLKNRSSVSETRSEKNRKRVTLRKTGEKKLRKLKIAKTKPNPYSGADPMSRSVKEAEQGTMNQLFLAELKKKLKQAKDSPYTGATLRGTRTKPDKTTKKRKLPGWAQRNN